MKSMLKLSIFTLLCVFTLNIYAQVPTSIDGVEIQTNIDNPRPGQVIEVYIESFLFDLNSASMVWVVDGKTFNSGVGMKSIGVTAPKIGVTMNVSVIVKAADGKEIRKSLAIKTGSVDIIWESHGYTPPFFKGKMPFAYQNTLRLIAVPHLSKDGVKELDPKTLVYTWKRSGKYIENGQGYGRQSVDISADDLPKELDISVEIHDREQTISTTGYITLAPGEPSVSFYEDNALYGILFNKSLIGNVPLKNREMKILAVPYSFSSLNQNSYVWSINNIEQSDLIDNRSVTIRTKEGAEGSSSINLDIRNQSNILQGARGGFTLYFSKTP